MTAAPASEYLTRTELHSLTDYARSAEQAAWRDYILKPNAPLFTRKERKPRGGGLYALFSKDDDLLYIGKTLSFNQRLNAHTWANKIAYQFFSVLDMPPELITDMEFAHIHALRPPINGLFAHWVHPERPGMIAAVREAWGVTAEDIEI